MQLMWQVCSLQNIDDLKVLMSLMYIHVHCFNLKWSFSMEHLDMSLLMLTLWTSHLSPLNILLLGIKVSENSPKWQTMRLRNLSFLYMKTNKKQLFVVEYLHLCFSIYTNCLIFKGQIALLCKSSTCSHTCMALSFSFRIITLLYQAQTSTP